MSSTTPSIRRVKDGGVDRLIRHIDFRLVGCLTAIHRLTGGLLDEPEQGRLACTIEAFEVVGPQQFRIN